MAAVASFPGEAGREFRGLNINPMRSDRGVLGWEEEEPERELSNEERPEVTSRSGSIGCLVETCGRPPGPLAPWGAVGHTVTS